MICNLARNLKTRIDFRNTKFGREDCKDRWIFIKGTDC